MQGKLFIGVDVAQNWIDIADTSGAKTGRVQRIDNTPDALARWAATLDRDRVGLVAFEPSGGLERPLRAALRDAGLPFARVHPNEVVAFRACHGVKAKTDAIDAALLARFAEQELSQRGLAPAVDGDDALRELVAWLPAAANSWTPVTPRPAAPAASPPRPYAPASRPCSPCSPSSSTPSTARWPTI